MNLYAETSAVLSWLLGEDRRAGARSLLAAAAAVHTSDLTLIECDRGLRRATATGRITARAASRLQAMIDTASAHWTLHSFPHEPVRALDAIHLATALAVRNLMPDVQVLSFDDRIRDNAAALGFLLA